MKILKTTSYATIIAITALITSCATAPTKTALELQAFQKKNFAAQKSVVFSSTMSVFQDLGYIIRNADKEAQVMLLFHGTLLVERVALGPGAVKPLGRYHVVPLPKIN